VCEPRDTVSNTDRQLYGRTVFSDVVEIRAPTAENYRLRSAGLFLRISSIETFQ
jgi:hypothetical protein